MAFGDVLCVVRVTQSVSWKVIQPHVQVCVLSVGSILATGLGTKKHGRTKDLI